ncbi:hypothetical protein HY641_02595 [Candidatus Woesearchaeota archaeon]|nr:hypothetical protein [Candidatus Woesearchaeota archaeon]
MQPVHVTNREHIYKQLFRVKSALKEHFQGDVVAPFVGRIGYPHLNIGMLAPVVSEQESWLHDAPCEWAAREIPSATIIDLRSELLNSRFKAHIKAKPRLLELAREAAMSHKPTEMEIKLKSVPKMSISLHQFSAPTGPKGDLLHAALTSNPTVSSKVERVVDGNDWKAADAITYLYGNGFDETFLTRLLSVGTVGLKTERKLVPTRWSITATDDIIGKQIIDEIADHDECGYTVRFGGHLGNYFLVLTFPGPWSYELFELMVGRGQLEYSTDHEFHQGRKRYADETAGGYYASRLAVLEMLKEQRERGRVLCLRFITPEYDTPLGVWVVREAARKATRAAPIAMDSLQHCIVYAKTTAQQFDVDLDPLLSQSKLLTYLKTQRTLSAFAFRGQQI